MHLFSERLKARGGRKLGLALFWSALLNPTISNVHESIFELRKRFAELYGKLARYLIDWI